MTLVEKMRAAESAVKAAQGYKRRADVDPMEMERLVCAAEDAMRAVAAEFVITATTLRLYGDVIGAHASTGYAGVSYVASTGAWTIVLP